MYESLVTTFYFASKNFAFQKREKMSSIISGESDQYGIPGLGENKQKPSTYQVLVASLRVTQPRCVGR